MTPEEMKQVHDTHVAAENRSDLEGALATYVDDCFYEIVAFGSRADGKDAVRAVYTATMAGLPQSEFDIQGEAFGDDTLVAWGIYHATVGGPFLGQEPTGKRLALPMIVVNSFRDGKMAGERIYFDLATMCAQGGLDLDKVRQVIQPAAAHALGGLG
jgi:steroid delta-isomerase-like uncharacterized protein